MTVPEVRPLAPAANVAGIDIGGTKTHLRLRTPGSERDLVLPTAEWRVRDWDRDARSLLDLLAGLAEGTALSAIGIGAHGCDDQEECRAFTDAFRRAGPVPVRVVNDAELMPAAFGLDRQIGVVAGTGSIAVCRTGAGEMLVAGGWGWILGDEGSAASMVRAAARRVALHLDTGGTDREPLVRHLFAALEIPTPARIGSRLGRIGLEGGAVAVGGKAGLVFEAAAEGSELAAEVIRDGGLALAELVARLQARGAGATAAVAGGGVIVAQPRLWQAFRDGLARLVGPGFTAELHRGPPVDGAIVLADRLAATLPTALSGGSPNPASTNSERSVP